MEKRFFDTFHHPQTPDYILEKILNHEICIILKDETLHTTSGFFLYGARTSLCNENEGLKKEDFNLFFFFWCRTKALLLYCTQYIGTEHRTQKQKKSSPKFSWV